MRASRIAMIAGAAFAVLSSLFVVALAWTGGQRPAGGLVSSTGTAAIGGPFQMIDEEGRPVSEADLKGKPTALFFGFTYCPDVCPTTLFELTGLMEKLGPQVQDMNFVFVTVDPERDTPEILDEYLSAFDERLRGFTGTPEQVERITEAYRVQYRKVETEAGYTMDHTASVYLMDENNEFVGTISYNEDPATALEKLRRLIGNA